MILLNIDQKKYGNTFELSDIKLKIAPSKVTLLLGHNGSGKTTIIKSLLGLTEYKGNCSIEDTNISYKDSESINFMKKNISYISDHAALYEFLTPYEYFNLIKSMQSKVVDESYLERLIKLFEIGKYLKVPIGDLSYGNKKKVQIVSHLCWKPKYVVFDEPTNGLDPDMVIILKKVLQVVKGKGTGILLSTHNLSFGENLMDHIIIIRNGNELLNSSIQELIKKFGTFDLESIYQSVNEEYYQEIEGLIHELSL
ncbi:ATP-binding cassette domain-containing protein [Alkalihalobacterium bogoriense]|uniref:ATP-binding cassette domain-containing protein n=1 Tax=Alkalihalobacterium bogoriense TaxID=246272 RepID=UPI00047C2BCC|nr:ABC transporter ATP-binding protein [Alkalihalobacterium bogoriense]